MNGHDQHCVCCSEGIDSFMQQIKKIINDDGHAIIGTQTEYFGQVLSMSYTVGLAEKGLPEIVVFSIPAQHAAVMLNTAAEMLENGKLPLDVPINEIANMPAYFKSIKPEATVGFLNIANNRAGKPVDAIQLVWPDVDGKFMWEDDYRTEFLLAQPPLFLQ